MSLQPQSTRFLIGFPAAAKAEVRNPTWQVTDKQLMTVVSFLFSEFAASLLRIWCGVPLQLFIVSGIFFFFFYVLLQCLHLAVAHLEALGCPGPLKSQKSWIWDHPCRLWHNPDLRWTFDELQLQKKCCHGIKIKMNETFRFVCLFMLAVEWSTLKWFIFFSKREIWYRAPLSIGCWIHNDLNW